MKGNEHNEQTETLLLQISPAVFNIYQTLLILDPHFVPVSSFQIIQRARESGRIAIQRDLLGNVTGHEILAFGNDGKYFRPSKYASTEDDAIRASE